MSRKKKITEGCIEIKGQAMIEEFDCLTTRIKHYMDYLRNSQNVDKDTCFTLFRDIYDSYECMGFLDEKGGSHD